MGEEMIWMDGDREVPPLNPCIHLTEICFCFFFGSMQDDPKWAQREDHDQHLMGFSVAEKFIFRFILMNLISCCS